MIHLPRPVRGLCPSHLKRDPRSIQIVAWCSSRSNTHTYIRTHIHIFISYLYILIHMYICNCCLFTTEQHRNFYYAVRAKAERKSNHDVSMIVDAAGGQGTIYQPRMMTVAKNEPERHTMLKTTCTFTKVHGLGTLITQSFPDIEGKGSNLTPSVFIMPCRHRSP